MNYPRKIGIVQPKHPFNSQRIFLAVLLSSAILLSCSISYNPDKNSSEAPQVTEEIINTVTQPALEQPTPTPIPSVNIGSLTVTQDGGVFQSDGVTIAVSGGWIPDPIQIEVDRLDFSADTEGSPAGYRLRGPLNVLPGSITVTMPIIPEGNGQEPTITLGERVFAPSAGYIYVTRPLVTQVDRATGTLSTMLDLAAANGGRGSLPVKVAASLPNPHASALALRDPAVEIDFRQVRPPDVNQVFQSEHFAVHNLMVAVPETDLKALLALLEKQRQLIKDLGFELNSGSGHMDVWVKELNPDRFGEFHPGIFFSDLAINRLYLKDENTLNKNLTELNATAAHELLHWVQWLYDYRDAFSRTLEAPFTYSLDEATATWIEPLAVGNPDFLPVTALNNRNFVFFPVLPPYVDAATAKEVQNRGYGASLYLRYVTKKIGSNFISQLLAFARSHSVSLSASVLDSVLSQNDINFSDSYAAFIETLMTKPGEIVSGLESPAAGKYVTARAQDNPDPAKSGDFAMSFVTSSELRNNAGQNKPGYLLSGPAPALVLNFKVIEASMEAVIVSVEESTAAAAVYVNRPQPLKIEMSGEEGTRMLVFTKHAVDAAWQLAGNGPVRNSALTVEGFGSTVKRVLVVPFTNSLDGYADEFPAPKTKVLSLDLTLPVVVEPVAAPAFDCSCMDSIQPLGMFWETEPSVHEDLFKSYYWKYVIASPWTLNSDGTLCQVTREDYKKKFKEDPYVFDKLDVYEGWVCNFWALCNGRTEYDQTGCPYASP